MHVNISTVFHIPSSPAFAIVENDAEMFADVHDVLRHLLWKSFACGKNCDSNTCIYIVFLIFMNVCQMSLGNMGDYFFSKRGYFGCNARLKLLQHEISFCRPT